MEGQQLPKATMGSFVKKNSDLHCSPDFITRLLELSKEYISRLADKSNDICQLNKKKTISAEHLEQALDGFELNHHIDHLKKLGSEIKEINGLKREATKRLEETIQRERQEERERRLKESPPKKEVIVRQQFDQLDLHDSPAPDQDDYEELAKQEEGKQVKEGQEAAQSPQQQ